MGYDDTAEPNLVVQGHEHMTVRQYVVRTMGYERAVRQERISPGIRDSDEEFDGEGVKSEDEEEYEEGPRRFPSTTRRGAGSLGQDDASSAGPAPMNRLTPASQRRLAASTPQRGRAGPQSHYERGRSASPDARSHNQARPQRLDRFHDEGQATQGTSQHHSSSHYRTQSNTHHHAQSTNSHQYPATQSSAARRSMDLTHPTDPPLPRGYTAPGYTPGHNAYRALDRSQRALGARPRIPAQGWQAGDEVIIVEGPSREEREGGFSWGGYGRPGREMRGLIEPVEHRRARLESRGGQYGVGEGHGVEDDEILEGEE
ncbi:MAG: hypothetical protein Q9174_006065 [Haloplaca sp. 1 TL-2023]